MTVGIDPSFRTICLATWVCHGSGQFFLTGPYGWERHLTLPLDEPPGGTRHV